MKSFRSALIASTLTLGAMAAATVAAHADLPAWMQTAISGSVIEAALFRAMDIPATRTLYPRPPAEARTQLDPLVAAHANDAELYAVRAHVEEQALDFASAERDWNAFVAHSTDGAARLSARFALADFYHRRNQGAQEIMALEAAAAMPSALNETFLPAAEQTAWRVFPRALAVAKQQGLGDDATLAIYRAWIARYPHEPAARAQVVKPLLAMRRFAETQQAIDNYKTAFPSDQVFPIKAQALLAFDEGSPQATQHALALFDQAFQPVWDQDLVRPYFALLAATHTEHAAIAQARTRLQQNPDDLRSVAFLFDAFSQQGRSDAATNVLAAYAASKQQRHAAWTPDELYTFATMLPAADAARFYYALASTTGHLSFTSQTPEEAGLCGLISELLASGGSPVALGSGNLSIFRDIASTDQGPGYLNGILSLWLNSADPAAEFKSEENNAAPYFHIAKAAELLGVLDERFPASTHRAALHMQMIRALPAYGDDAAMLQAGKQFLAAFPQSPDRLEVAFDLADIDARKDDVRSELALYDMLLSEVSPKLQGYPLTAGQEPAAPTSAPSAADATDDDTAQPKPPTPAPASVLAQSLDVPVTAPPTLGYASEYRTVLDRYLSRLVYTGRLPDALALLRREIDRNPNDPLLYERLADFLQQNKLDAQQDAVYQEAIARFHTASFYDKLARAYLRQKQQLEFDALTRQVVDIFRGTELESYFDNVNHTWPEEYLQLNLYAHRRFPHDLVFTRNLLAAYDAHVTADPAAHELLLRQHWQDSPDLQAEFFDFLSRTDRMKAELASLESMLPSGDATAQNPAAAHELAELDLWQSHFEAAAPLLGKLSDQYPADTEIGDQAASLFRSLAYFDPPQAQRAAAIEQRLSAAEPANLDRLATIGDIFADSTNPALNLDAAQQLAQAAPFWRRMPEVHPGETDGYLQAATVFWDYFQFAPAMEQIEAARQHFHLPSLYAYQAGALEEGLHDNARAVAEYVAAATASGTDVDDSAASHSRVVALAKRPATAAIVDAATARAVDTNPSIEAITLRVDVLMAKGQSAAVAPLVSKAIAHAATAEQLRDLASFAENHNLPDARLVALERQVVLTTDPVERIGLQYELVRIETERHDTEAAARVIDAVYAANPRIVGVVRATIDFDWNNHREARAVAVLLEAAKVAGPDMAHDFTLEAVDKSNHSGDYAGARRTLEPLLTADPFNPLYLNLQAQSFSLAHDDAGVRDLYTRTITALESSQLPRLDKRAKIALARQSLIPALTSLKDYAAATDQHIALISAFPEDDATLENAISYARLHHREVQLIAFFNKTVAASPRDSRFFIDLARADEAFEDNAGALAAYSHAIAIRSDRPDLYIARAELEERAQDFDAACADYERLFNLTYKDPQWMLKEALARAREGKPELAVKALEAAYLSGDAPTPDSYFDVAKQLAQWNMIARADTIAAKGATLAGEDLAVKPSLQDDATFYAGLLAQERKAPEAIALFARLRDQAANDSPSGPAALKQQIAEHGLAAMMNIDWRRHFIEERKRTAETTFEQCVKSVASTAAALYTPEEQDSFGSLLDRLRTNRPAQEMIDVWIPAAAAANLKDREAAWRRDILLHDGLGFTQLSDYNSLELARMDFTTLGETLDAYVAIVKAEQRANVLNMAVTAWKDADNTVRESADLNKLVALGRNNDLLQRQLTLYLHGDRKALIALAGGRDVALSDAAANFALAQNDEPLTLAMTAAIPGRPPVWHNATRALIGLYFNDRASATGAAFDAALGPMIVGEQLGHKPNDQRQVTGDPWFDYGSRFGLFLALAPQPSHNAEDFLPAVLEHAATNPESYSALAQTYLDAHNLAAAIVEYRHAYELAPDDPSPVVSIAEAQLDAGHRDEALQTFREALQKLRDTAADGTPSESFWTALTRIAEDARQHHLATDLQPDMNAVFSTYLARNGAFRADEVLQDAWAEAGADDPQRAMGWLLELLHQVPADQRESAFDSLVSDVPIPRAQREPVLRVELDLAHATVAAASEQERPAARQHLEQIVRIYAQWLLDEHRSADAETVVNSLPANDHLGDGIERLKLLIAAQQAKLPALIEVFRSDPDSAPSLDLLSGVANALRLQRDNANSRALLEFIFARRLELQQLSDADYLALAQARIDTGEMPGALDLLHRLTQQGDFYANLSSAAALLERTQHLAEALAFLKPLARACPWDANVALRLAAAQVATHQPQAAATLTAVASDAQATYAVRVDAALALRKLGAGGHFASAELNLLAAAPAQATHALPANFVYARVTAAQTAAPAQAAPLLRSTLLTAPDSLYDFLRIRLFEADAALGHDSAASIAISSVLQSHSSLRSSNTATTESGTIGELMYADDSSASSGDDVEDRDAGVSAGEDGNLPDNDLAANPLHLFTLDDALGGNASQLAFELSLAEVDHRLGDNANAMQDLRAALALQTSPAQAVQINSRLHALDVAMRLDNLNAQRRPAIQPSLVQTTLVRPRLTALQEVNP